MATSQWTAEPLPPAVIAAVRRAQGQLVDGIVAAVGAENPIYAEVLGGPEGLAIRLGIEQAIRAFLQAIERGERPAADTAELWRRLGEGEFHAGRSLDALRTAFRTGTRAAWRGAAELAAGAGVSAPLVITLAEAIFVYTDELAADVVEGYLRMQSDEAGERERRRRRLAALLLDPVAHDPEALEHAAELARWSLPRRVAVLALAAETPLVVARRLDADVLAGADGVGAWLIVPDPDGPGRAAQLRAGIAITGIAAALGPSVAVGAAERSLRWARLTLRLVRDGALADAELIRTDEHLAALIVLQDLALAGALVARTLAPLDALPGADRARLTETLQAWLAHQRHTPLVAEALHVHPQTVRYRVRQLRELVGDALETPDGRFELELALRAQRGIE